MIKRLSKFIKTQGLSVRKFEQIIFASDGMIRRAITNNTDIQSKWITNIADNYPQLNLEWLLTGKGEMLRSYDNNNTDTSQVKPDASLIDKITQQAEQIGQLKNENKHQNEQIRKLSSENERLKNELEKLQPKRKKLQDSVIEHDSQIFDMSKLSPLSAPLAAEPPATHRWRPENDINAEQYKNK